MSRIVQTVLPPMEVKTVDSGGRSTPNAGRTSPVQSIALTAVVKDALLRHYGSFKAAAISMGEMDQGQLTRDLDSGKFKFERLELCDLAAKASVCRALAEHFGNTDPKAHVQRLVRNVRRALDELEEETA